MAIAGIEKNIGSLPEKAALRCVDQKAIYFDHEGASVTYAFASIQQSSSYGQITSKDGVGFSASLGCMIEIGRVGLDPAIVLGTSVVAVGYVLSFKI